MLLPTSNSNCPIGFQNEIYHGVAEKTKFLTLKCTRKNGKTQNSHPRSKSADRNKFRFCACTGPRKNKKSSKWYVKVCFIMRICFLIINLLFLRAGKIEH